jgi:hypothetical protein
MIELDVVARRWFFAEAISPKIGDCFALSGSQRHDTNSSLGTPRLVTPDKVTFGRCIIFGECLILRGEINRPSVGICHEVLDKIDAHRAGIAATVFMRAVRIAWKSNCQRPAGTGLGIADSNRNCNKGTNQSNFFVFPTRRGTSRSIPAEYCCGQFGSS